jgi:hypothetical protein
MITLSSIDRRYAPKLTRSKATSPQKFQIKGAADGRRCKSAATVELPMSAIITT